MWPHHLKGVSPVIEKQIESLGLLTQQKITQAGELLRAHVAEQGEAIESKRQAAIDLLESQIKELDANLADRLQEVIHKQEVIHRQEIDAIKAELEQQKGTGLLIEKEVNELDAAFAERLDDEKEQLAQRIVNQQLIHTIEIDTIKEQLENRKDIEQALTERIATIKDGGQGEQGPQGETGSDGLDRPLIEPVSLQDKDYQKGTLGTHAGGLWISTKQTMGSPETDALAWHCILDAMDTLNIDLQEDGSYELAVRMSTGRVIKNTLNIPYPEHCGIWEERDYTKGQIVTKGSCFWQAMEDTAGTPPGNGWRQILSAPRGKAGPAGKAIEGPQGKPGRNGRDSQLDDEFIADLRDIVSQYRGQG